MSFYFSFSNFEPLIYDETFFFLMQKPNWITYPIPAGSESYTRVILLKILLNYVTLQ